jgi:hypothetical protein
MADDEQTAKPPEPPRVRGITEQQYREWRHNPVTKMFRQYMLDWAADTRESVVEAWIERSLDQATDFEARARVKQLKELATMPFDAIAMFYVQHDEEKQTKPTNEDDEDDAS